MTALYDQIGKKYDSTRKADPEIVEEIFQLFDPVDGQKFLDVGCGTGNYTIALAEKGMNVTGLDVSLQMIETARKKMSSVEWVHGDAKHLPFSDRSFDGVLCFLAIHHIKELALFFSEAQRVLKPGGKIVIFTNSPQQFMQLWIVDYFPKMMAKAARLLFAKADVEEALLKAGFQQLSFEKFFVKKETQDAFLEIAKHYPEKCLDPNFQANVSPFVLAPDKEEVALGLKKLEQDIHSREIEKIMNRYLNPEGNFYYILGHSN